MKTWQEEFDYIWNNFNDDGFHDTEKSDVVLTANADSAGMGISLVLYVLIFNNEIWGL